MCIRDRYKRVCSKGSFLKIEASMAILKEDLSCSWPINSLKVRGRAKFRLLFLFSSGIIFESTSLSSFLRRENSSSPTLEEIIAIMKG